MQLEEGKDFSWDFVTADKLLSHGPCYFLYAGLTCGAGNCSVDIYDGENTAGTKICTLESLQHVTQQLHVTIPIYCRRGLYIDVGDNVTGALIQWKELGHKQGG